MAGFYRQPASDTRLLSRIFRNLQLDTALRDRIRVAAIACSLV
jgi:hypothetical protein